MTVESALQGMRAVVLVADGAEDLEYWVTVMRLREAGAEVTSVGTSLDPVKGKNGLPARADRLAADKPIGIICHGGLVAISAGIIERDHPATGSLGIRDDLVNAGARFVDGPAFRDGNIVWGRVVDDIPDFNRELVALFAEHNRPRT